jgi:transposase
MVAQAKISSHKIGKILRHFCIDVDATKTAKLTGINRNTVNRYFGLFREAIYWHRCNELRRIVGVVELDESYFGPKRRRGVPGKRGRGTDKQPVFGIFERGGAVYTEIIPDCKRQTLRPIILGRIDPKSIVATDKWRGYDGLVDVGYDKHIRVNHSKTFVNGKTHAHINGIESFWSFTKRRLAKFNGCKKNFHLHLKECEWRWNRNEMELEKELRTIFLKFQRSLLV